MNYQIISYYTENTPYEKEVRCLQASLEKLGLSYKVYKRPSKGSWKSNTRQKIDVIHQAMLDFPDKNIVWLDADAEVKQKPDLFEYLICDLGFHIRVRSLSKFGIRGLSAGTLFIKNNEEMRLFVEDWSNYGKDTDQEALYHILTSPSYKHLCVESLPPSYSKIKGDTTTDRYSTVIQQNQASKRLRNKV